MTNYEHFRKLFQELYRTVQLFNTLTYRKRAAEGSVDYRRLVLLRKQQLKHIAILSAQLGCTRDFGFGGMIRRINIGNEVINIRGATKYKV